MRSLLQPRRVHPSSVQALALALLGTAPVGAQTHGWVQRTPTLQPAARGFSVMAYDWARGECVMFGGWDGTSSVGDTWKWDGATWTQAAPANAPSPRCCHMMAYDVARGRVVLFGGADGFNPDTNDTWEWDGTNWTQRTPLHSPLARRVGAMVYDVGHNVTVLFGGQQGSSPNLLLNDTWQWNGVDWTQRTPATSPPARSACAMAYDLLRQRTVMYGGIVTFGSLFDTWEWDGTDWTQQMTTQFPTVQSRLRAVGAIGKVLLVGGESGGTYPDTTWIWDGTNWIQDLSPGPGGRSEMPLAFDVTRNVAVVFGGYAGAYLGDTWEYDPGQAAGYTTYGIGCPGSLGVPSLDAVPGSRPALGVNFELAIGNVPFGFAVMATGLSDTMTTSGIALPFDLGVIGMPGCPLGVDPLVLQTVAGAGTSLTWSWLLPNNPALFGLTFVNQALVLDPPANAFGFTISNAGKATLGY